MVIPVEESGTFEASLPLETRGHMMTFCKLLVGVKNGIVVSGLAPWRAMNSSRPVSLAGKDRAGSSYLSHWPWGQGINTLGYFGFIYGPSMILYILF